MLIRPKPFVNEFILGYIGRLTHVNLKNTCAETMRNLVSHFELDQEEVTSREHYYQAERYLRALALTSGRTLDEFIFYHSNLPARGLGRESAAAWLNWQMRRKWELGFSGRKPPYLCPECISQQVCDVGISFWHRYHQLDGIYWCPKHKIALLAIDDWFTRPALVPTTAFASLRTATKADDYDNYPVLQIFSEIMVGFLERSLYWSLDRIQECLRRQAISKGLLVENGDVPRVPDDSQFLVDLALSKFPAWWLNEVFDLRSATPSKGRSALNRVFSAEGRTSSASYALALSLLLSAHERDAVLK
ncbi:TniQ family protein [Paraburkholderia nemoris]|uniref:TniQ family protein n=1 Tax=Paraburkholderia nemoris TaxID=2793076 RepID=UPI0038B7586E